MHGGGHELALDPSSRREPRDPYTCRELQQSMNYSRLIRKEDELRMLSNTQDDRLATPTSSRGWPDPSTPLAPAIDCATAAGHECVPRRRCSAPKPWRPHRDDPPKRFALSYQVWCQVAEPRRRSRRAGADVDVVAEDHP